VLLEIKSYGVFCCAKWYRVIGIAKDCNAFIFRFMQSKKTLYMNVLPTVFYHTG